MTDPISYKCAHCDQKFISQNIQIPPNTMGLFHKECWDPMSHISFLGNGYAVQSSLMAHQLKITSVDPQCKQIIEYIIAFNAQIGETTLRL